MTGQKGRIFADAKPPLFVRLVASKWYALQSQNVVYCGCDLNIYEKEFLCVTPLAS